MRPVVVGALLLSIGLVSANAQQKNSTVHYQRRAGKHVSPGISSKNHHADYTAAAELNKRGTSEKVLQKELSKIEDQSTRLQAAAPVRKPAKLNPAPPPKVQSSDRTPAINFSYQPKQNKLTQNKASGPAKPGRGGVARIR